MLLAPISMLALDQVQTVAFAGIVLFVGYGIRRLVPVLARYNIPAPVVGGLLVAIAITTARARGVTLLEFNTGLQSPLMIAFFTSIGFGASLSLLRVGGPAVVLFFASSTVMAVAQNAIGAGVALALGQPPLLGVLAGSVTLTGGPATGLAFAPLFESAGVQGAATIAVAAAMVGIVSGGIVGGPLGTWLIARRAGGSDRGQTGVRRGSDRGQTGVRPGSDAGRTSEFGGVPVMQRVATNVAEDHLPEPIPRAPEGEDVEAYGLLKSLVLILAAMWAGSWLTVWFASIGLTLPAYIGAMLVAAALRNADDGARVIGISQRTIDDLGAAALSLFLVMALMTLRLWDLVGLALPLTVMLAVQVLAVAVAAAGPMYWLMGRDYESAVMSSGFVGFMLGTTANAMANMTALVERYGPAPKAFLVVPMVGAFFIDFTNALIITVCLNIWR
ncbi:MAG TPA: sodium/glutamate symporter [Vicinamibacterales bacterium]|nr:sodium/glutamate symporter [Vicinamibacterales bacterium]